VPSCEVALDPAANRTGNVWHVLLPGLDKDVLYGGLEGG
jgi:hypothetical protein